MVHQGAASYSGGEFSYALPDLSYLPKGIYTLETVKSNQQRTVIKLIKQ
jgi:hypothetical protein